MGNLKLTIMKFIKSIFVALTILSVISLTSAKRSSRAKAKVHADAVTTGSPKLVEYEASLLIKDADNSNKYQVKLDQDSFNQMNYGIQFSMETGAITNPAFFLVSANTYLFNFKNAHDISCINQATFTTTTMNFSVYVNQKTYDIIFTFPNGWAFGSNVNVLSLCNKFSDKWTSTQSTRNTLSNEIMKLYSHIKLLEMTRTRNQNTKQGLQEQNTMLTTNIQSMNNTVITQRADIDQIGKKSSAESQKLDAINDQIREKEALLATQQDFVDEARGNMADIRKVSNSEIENEWNSFKVSFQKLINIHSSEDPLKSTLERYISNVKANVNSIMSATRI